MANEFDKILIRSTRYNEVKNVERPSPTNGFTTAFTVLHLVTLTIKDGSFHGSDHLVPVKWELKVSGPSQ